jgi:Tfp pilus assembly protein PilN
MSTLEQVQGQTLTTGGLRAARVNLLPPEIEDARRLKRTQAGLALGLAAVVVALGGVYAVEAHDKAQATDELAASKAQGVQLQQEQAKYADVPRTIAAIDAAEGARSTAMANDVEWYRTLNNFAVTLPKNVWFTTLTLATNAGGSSAGAAAPAPTTTTPAPTSGTAAPAAGIGVLTVAGSAMDHPDVATWLDTLARQPGMTNAYFTNSVKAKIGDTTIVNFQSTATITDAALSHRYDRKQG